MLKLKNILKFAFLYFYMFEFWGSPLKPVNKHLSPSPFLSPAL